MSQSHHVNSAVIAKQTKDSKCWEHVNIASIKIVTHCREPSGFWLTILLAEVMIDPTVVPR